MMSPYSSLLSQAALSTTKTLERGEGQAVYQLQNLLISQEGLQTPDEVYNSNAGVRDILDPVSLARWAFLTFLTAGEIFFHASLAAPWGSHSLSANQNGNSLGWLSKWGFHADGVLKGVAFYDKK